MKECRNKGKAVKKQQFCHKTESQFHQGMYLTIWCKSLSCSAGTKAPTQVEDGNYMLRPQTGWNQRADDWDFCNTTLLPHHQPLRRKSCALQPSPLVMLPFKTLPWKPLGSLDLLSLGCLFSLLGPAINLSLLHTPTFQFVWPHCASGTQTWVWQNNRLHFFNP